MADQEFQESDIIFQENVGEDQYDQNFKDVHRRHPNCKKLKRSKNKKKQNSRPVNIPKNTCAPTKSSTNWFIRPIDSFDNEELFDDDDDDDDDVRITPPHVILGQRMNGKMAFSVCTGDGRTLKGRHLSQVRNSILRMTGFLES